MKEIRQSQKRWNNPSPESLENKFVSMLSLLLPNQETLQKCLPTSNTRETKKNAIFWKERRWETELDSDCKALVTLPQPSTTSIMLLAPTQLPLNLQQAPTSTFSQYLNCLLHLLLSDPLPLSKLKTFLKIALVVKTLWIIPKGLPTSQPGFLDRTPHTAFLKQWIYI